MIFLIPGGSGRDLRVSAYLIADNAAMIENMDTSHIGDVTDIILIGSAAWFGTDGRVGKNKEFNAIISGVREKIVQADHAGKERVIRPDPY